jgi:hypothetical protein
VKPVSDGPSGVSRPAASDEPAAPGQLVQPTPCKGCGRAPADGQQRQNHSSGAAPAATLQTTSASTSAVSACAEITLCHRGLVIGIGMPRVTPPGGCRRAQFQVICPTWRPRRGKRRRRRSRAGPGCREPALAYRIVVRGSACEAASCTSRSGNPLSSAAVMNACRSICGVTALAIPARRAVVRTIRPAPCRSSRRPSLARNSGPSVRSPTARSMAREFRGASEMVATLPPLRVIVRVRWPRSRPRCSMSEPAASDIRSPFSASSEISACQAGGPSPAATSSAPSSLRSSATAWDSESTRGRRIAEPVPAAAAAR